MYQLSGSTQAALDYNSNIIGALEVSEKKWVLAQGTRAGGGGNSSDFGRWHL